jgi:hypothetical protein
VFKWHVQHFINVRERTVDETEKREVMSSLTKVGFIPRGLHGNGKYTLFTNKL